MSPVPFFQQVRQVGLMCAVDATPERTETSPDEGALCDLAVAEMTNLIGAGGPPVVAFVRNDERIADPGALVVLLHATLRGAAPGSVLALSATLHRAKPEAGAPPFFMVPPQATTAAGEAVPLEDARGALRHLLAGVARAILDSVDIQDSPGFENLIQAPFREGGLNVRGSFDPEGSSVGSDGTTFAGQAQRSRPDWR